MVTAFTARCLLIAVFAAAGLGALLALGRPAMARAATARAAMGQAAPARAVRRLSDAFHFLMCAAVGALTWWSEPALAGWLQTAVFGCAVIWFALVSPAVTAKLRPVSLAGAHHAL